MANIGRAYGRIIPTVAALLRDIFWREKKRAAEGQDEEDGASRPADVQDVVVHGVASRPKATPEPGAPSRKQVRN
ncbi:hypothetical protein KM043_018029 [Ampulex compressa]|nr:hypothetical protein KM043_018029 [Ampulex compressa]